MQLLRKVSIINRPKRIIREFLYEKHRIVKSVMHFYVSLSVCGVFLVQRAVDRGRLRYVLPIAEHAG